ncbi:MAG: hypothetical protein R2752_22190, partial [Vicinamibacterales bacterium]
LDHQVPLQFRGYRVRAGTAETSGLRATPILTSGGAAPVAVAVPDFWQNFPRAIEGTDTPDGTDGRDARHAGRLVVRFLPRQSADLHELQGGEQKTHVCVIAAGADPVTALALDWCRNPLVAVPDPAWTFAAGAVPWLAPDEPGHAALIGSAIAGPDTFVHKREVVDEYGWRHFGDIYGDHEAIRHQGPDPLVSHYNNQYDPVAGFLYQYLRSGDPRWWSMADELAAHVIDIDVYHTTRDKSAYNHGMFWHTYHYGDADTSTHRTYPVASRGITHGGGPSPDHNYTTGLMLHYLLTGDEASRETVLGLARYVVDVDDGGKTVFRWLSRAPTGLATASGSYAYHGPGRGPANAVNALLDGHRLSGDPAFLAKAEALIARVAHPEEPIERLKLDEPEHRWFYLMFFQSLGKYLWWKAVIGQRDERYAYARATLLHYARWMADHEYPYLDRPEKLEFPTETWAAHEARKSDVFAMAAQHAGGDERARFVERSRFFFRYAVDTLGGMATRTLARPVIVLLSSGLVLPWLEAHPDAAAPPPERTPASFGVKPVFVPQKQIAMRRAKRLAAGAALAGLAAAAALVWSLWVCCG